MEFQHAATIEIRGATLELLVGFSREERSTRQPIRLDIRIHFDSPPPAVESDRLGDTVCYAALLEALGERLRGGEYCLLEHLCGTCCDLICERVSDGAAGVSLVEVRAAKLNPPLPGVEQTAFTLRRAAGGQ